jgi:flavin reductase (DIM6/NTAB) family NADH-FMN oxidoreductase RutF
MAPPLPDKLVPLPTDQPIWERFFNVAPLVLIGSKEDSGRHDLAPKHMAMPLGWNNYFCFVCSPRHATYHNVRRTRQFTVSYPRPTQILQASLAAAPRTADQAKPSLRALPTFAATRVNGVLVQGCYLYLECELHSVTDGFGENSLIIGEIVAAAVQENALRRADLDDNELIYDSPLLAYLSPGRFAEVRESNSFPFPVAFSR